MQALDNAAFKVCSAVRLKIPFGAWLAAPWGRRFRGCGHYLTAVCANGLSTHLCSPCPRRASHNLRRQRRGSPLVSRCCAVLRLDLAHSYRHIVCSDIERLWRTFDDWGPDAVFGCAPDSPHPAFHTDYVSDSRALPVAPQFPRGLNAGVLLVSMDRLRSPGVLREYWSEVERAVKEGGYAAPRLGNHSHGLSAWAGGRGVHKVYSTTKTHPLLMAQGTTTRICA